MKKRAIALSVLVLLGACSSDGAPDTSSTADGATQPAQAWQAFAQCARANGQPDFPDPVLTADGQVRLPGVNLDAATFDRLQSACGAFLSNLEGGGKAVPDVTPETVAAAQRFAECMREQGIRDWPDADPTKVNEFFFPMEVWEGAKSGEQRAAVDACLPEFGGVFG